ncbi:MAG: PDZ domain-containing protein [Phycisphaeraceae bacterium]|nr:MAG: PDZ domain-containing protein [Phycisphaeraceae bacterium]
MRRFLVYGPALLVLITAAMTLIAGPAAIRQIEAARTSAKVTLAQQRLDEDDILQRINERVRDVADAIEPSVVFIRASGGGARAGRGRATGSGWVYDESGHIVTNAHVVQAATSIDVNFYDGRVRRATFIGADESTDVAIIKVDPDPTLLFPARRATGEPLHQGEAVFAFGSPFGFKFSMSKGIISGLGREARAMASSARYSNFIQTDAAINPGNSGGPLVDVRGRVIGMNTAIITDDSRTDSGAIYGVSGGIGFAIPLETVEVVVNQLIERGVVVRGYLGVGLGDLEMLPPQALAELGLPAAVGVLVTHIERGLAADRAGIQVNDVIMGVDGVATPSTAVLRSLIGHKPAGDLIELDILRDGERVTIPVTLGAAIINAAGQLEPIADARLRAIEDGMMRPAEVEQALERFGVLSLETARRSAAIGAVRNGSQADEAGFRAGQRIVGISRQRASIRTSQALLDALALEWAARGERPIPVRVIDPDGEESVLEIQLRRSN